MYDHLHKEELEMKTWLITGCSSGIGKGIASAVLEKGDQAIVTARNIDSVKELVDKYPNTAFGSLLDVTNKESIKQAVQTGIDRFGSIDVLVNNAGYGYRSAIEEGEQEAVNTLFETNFFGPIALIKEVLPQMREKKSGAIINVSSIAAVRSGVGSGYYAASKAALELMSDGLSKELKPLGIKVMIVQPGAFRTNFYDDSLKGTTKQIDDYKQTAGKTRKENIVNLHAQPGDPTKAGQVIVETIEKDDYPSTLSLGSDAVNIVSEALQARLQQIQEYQKISIQSDYDK